MREGILLLAAAGCALTAFMFGKTSENDWGDVLMSVVFAGLAGVLMAAAAG